jgi:pimeloyl-ACP methyl ester carboxylesterase
MSHATHIVVPPAAATLRLGDASLELIDRGQGPPLLFLHPGLGIDPSDQVLDLLASKWRVLAPSHPGFGRSERPRHINTVDDLAYLYLDLLDALNLRDTIVVGVSFGAWIAAEMAIKSTERISRLVLSDAVGIKLADRETAEIVDFFTRKDRDVDALSFHDPAHVRDVKSLSDDELLIKYRNREATALYTWSPYMHDPKLKGRLHRIRIPTLFLWGASDRIVPESYGRGFCALVPDATFQLIAHAGHYPHLEQPQAFAQRIVDFAATSL